MEPIGRLGRRRLAQPRLVQAYRTRPFFPVGTTGPAIEQIEAAKRVCQACDANEPCLEFALATNQESGIWGGTSEEERRKLRKAWLAGPASRLLNLSHRISGRTGYRRPLIRRAIPL